VSSSVRRRGYELTLLDSSGSFYRQAIPKTSLWPIPESIYMDRAGGAVVSKRLRSFENTFIIILSSSVSPVHHPVGALLSFTHRHHICGDWAGKLVPQLGLSRKHARKELWTRANFVVCSVKFHQCTDLIFYAV